VKVWDAQTGQEQLSLTGHTSWVTSVAFSADGKRLVSGSRDETVKVWDAQTGQEQLSLQGHSYGILSVGFSPDGTRIVSGGEDSTLKVWDAQTGQETLTLKGHTDPVWTVAFSADGKRIASGSGGIDVKSFKHWGKLKLYKQWGEVKVWNARKGPEVISLKGHTSATGRWLVDPDYSWHAAQAEESWQRGDWFAASFHLARLLPARPWDAALHVSHAYALSRLGRTVEAARHYLQAVLLDPRVRLWPLDPNAARRGETAAQANDWPRAVADLELAAHQPDATLYTWASLLLARRAAAPKDALLSCRELLDRFENNPGLSLHLLDSCRITPCDEAEARRLVKVAERLVAARRDADSLSFLGGALYRAGRFEEATRTLQESIKLHGQGGYAVT